MKRTLTVALVGLSTLTLFGCAQSFDKTSYLNSYNSSVNDALNSANTFESALKGANDSTASDSLGSFERDSLALSKLGQTPGFPSNIADNLNTTLSHINDLEIRGGILDGFIDADKSSIQNVDPSTLQPVVATLDQVINELKTDQSNAQQLLK